MIPGTFQVTAQIAPTSTSDTYATHSEEYGKGGYRTVASTIERDAIPAARRKSGMIVYVDGDQEYRLESDLTTWTAVPAPATPTDVMLKSVYDPNDDGVVVDSDKLGGQAPAWYTDLTNMTGELPQSQVTGLIADLLLKIPLAQKGAANGVAPLNGATQIDPIYLPISGLGYQGTWDANTNTPTINSGVGSNGDFYWVSVAGATMVDGYNTWTQGQAIVFNGGLSIWQPAVIASGIPSWNGLTGPVTATTANLPESTDKNYVTDDQADGLDLAPVSSSNRVATMSDLLGISVGGSYFNAELFSDGQTLGDGTVRTLASLGYTNGTAAAIWTRVASDPRFTISVASMTIDWIAHQEAMLAMEQNGFNGFTAPGGRGYCFNQTCQLPRDQTAVNFWTRSFMFKYNFNGSRYANRTGTNFVFFEKMPADQTEAGGLRLVYKYLFDSASFYGNNSTNANDCFIRLGATSSAQFKNLEGEEMDRLIDAQFCLQVAMENINVGSFGTYGIALRNGTWTAATANNSQCNNASVYDYHSYNGSGKTPVASVYSEGNRLVTLDKVQFEGVNGSQHHILFDWNGATTIKDCLRITDMDIESAGASRAGIRVIGNGIQAMLDGFNNQVSSADMPVLFEAEADGYPSYSPMQIMIQNAAPDFHTGWAFRHLANVDFDIKWYIHRVRLANNASVINASNWNTALPSTFIPDIGSIDYQSVL